MEQNTEPRNKPAHYGQLIYNNGAKNTQWGNNSLVSKWHCENWIATCKKMKLEYLLTT